MCGILWPLVKIGHRDMARYQKQVTEIWQDIRNRSQRYGKILEIGCRDIARYQKQVTQRYGKSQRHGKILEIGHRDMKENRSQR